MPRRAVPQQRYQARPARRVVRAHARVARNQGFRSAAVLSATVTNVGTVDTAPVLSKTSVTGPTTVYFESLTQGKTVWVNVPAGSGDLSVDFATKTVTFGGATVSDAITQESRWWTLDPGANAIRSNVAASVTYRDAYTN